MLSTVRPQEAGPLLLCFSTDAEPLWACCCFCFCWVLSCPRHDRSTLPQRKRYDWNFTFLLCFHPSLWGRWRVWCFLAFLGRSPRLDIHRFYLLGHQRSSWRTFPGPWNEGACIWKIWSGSIKLSGTLELGSTLIARKNPRVLQKCPWLWGAQYHRHGWVSALALSSMWFETTSGYSGSKVPVAF